MQHTANDNQTIHNRSIARIDLSSLLTSDIHQFDVTKTTDECVMSEILRIRRHLTPKVLFFEAERQVARRRALDEAEDYTMLNETKVYVL